MGDKINKRSGILRQKTLKVLLLLVGDEPRVLFLVSIKSGDIIKQLIRIKLQKYKC